MNGALNQIDINEAVAVAKKSQIVVLVCGTDQDTGREGKDRTDIVLPGAQQQLIQAVYQANPQTILVLVTGFSLSVVYAQDNLPAIMSAWFAGQAQGTAIADVIFGDYNPGGKLASTWYKSINDIPSKYDYDVKNNRTYMYFKGTPLYPFGYGLSYTTFNYSNIALSSTTLGLGNSVDVSADITNTGSRAGEEVTQLYINIPSTLVRPTKQLKGFSRIALQPGETKNVKFKLTYEDLQYYNEATRNFEVEGDPVNIYVGSSSQDIRLTASVNSIAGTVSSTYRQSPYIVTQAENYENKTATVALKSTSDGDLCIDSLVNNSHVVFKNMNFDAGVRSFKACYASMQSGGSISVVLDKLTEKEVGNLKITPTGNINTYMTDSCDLSAISGVRDVYLVFKGGTSVCKLN
ncbi:MAG: glycoside hydrolase family 3 C-terminal domain-containing protein [Paludibacter sp.]|nr:glycoside hydrolase family 3 C-terminal domain-containing protein [Paludibacter sp.]